MSWLDPRLWGALLALVLASVLSGYAYGVHVTELAQAGQLATVTQAARTTETELQHSENKASTAYLARTEFIQEKAHALPKITLASDCRVPAAVSRVLNSAQRVSTDANARPEPGAASEEADSTCAAELDIAKRNYAEVCEPNAAQLTELQVRWELVRSSMNRGGAGGG
jgi:hypothetical protein